MKLYVRYIAPEQAMSMTGPTFYVHGRGCSCLVCSFLARGSDMRFTFSGFVLSSVFSYPQVTQLDRMRYHWVTSG